VLIVGLGFILIFASQMSFLGVSRQNRLRSFTGSFLTYSNVKISPSVAQNLYITSSTVKRTEYLQMALERFKDHPILGIGAGNLLLKYQDNLP
jgi:O-antigen ligase